jgi:hypothetical protein
LGSGETEMLTRDFAYLTHIIPIADEVLLIGGAVKGAENIAVQLYELDITTKALTKVSWDSDFDVKGDEIYYVNDRLKLSGINQNSQEKCKGSFVFGTFPYYDPERGRLFFISGNRKIRYYDMHTQEFTTVFESGMVRSAVNNMTFIKGHWREGR